MATARTIARQLLAAALDFPFDVDRYIDQAIRSGVANPADYAYTLILRSPEFAAYYPGIRRPRSEGGGLRMSISEYNARQEAFTSTAAQFGFSLSRADVGRLVSQNVDPQEFQVRARGVQQVRTNPEIMAFLNQQISLNNAERRARGVRELPTVRTTADAVDFFTRQADHTVYALYEGALFQAAAAGLPGITAPGVRGARGLAAKTEGVTNFADLVEAYRRISGEIELAGAELGVERISQRELEILEFGGPSQASIASKVERILKTRKAQLEVKPITARVGLKRGRPVIDTFTREESL